jgi:hypothetical protein
MDFLTMLAGLTFLAMVGNRLTEGLIKPITDSLESNNKLSKDASDKILMYLSWLVSGVIVYLSGLNMFTTYLPNNLLAGQILTALVGGGGSNLIADLWPQKPSAVPMPTLEE